MPSYHYKKMRKDIVKFDCPRCDVLILEKLTQFANNEQHVQAASMWGVKFKRPWDYEASFSALR